MESLYLNALLKKKRFAWMPDMWILLKNKANNRKKRKPIMDKKNRLNQSFLVLALALVSRVYVSGHITKHGSHTLRAIVVNSFS